MRLTGSAAEVASLEQLRAVVQKQIDDRVVNKERLQQQHARLVDQEILGL